MRTGLTGHAVGAVAGIGFALSFATLVLAAVTLLLASRVLGRPAIPSLLVGAGGTLVLVLGRALLNADPAVSYAASTYVAAPIGGSLLAVGLYLQLGLARRR